MSTDIALEPFIPDQTNAPAHAAARGAALIAGNYPAAVIVHGADASGSD